MPLIPSVIGLVGSLALFAVATFLSRRPPEVGKVRMIPWTAVMFAALLATWLFARHLVTLTSASP